MRDKEPKANEETEVVSADSVLEFESTTTDYLIFRDG
jgi:hypothetical protein